MARQIRTYTDDEVELLINQRKEHWVDQINDLNSHIHSLEQELEAAAVDRKLLEEKITKLENDVAEATLLTPKITDERFLTDEFKLKVIDTEWPASSDPDEKWIAHVIKCMPNLGTRSLEQMVKEGISNHPHYWGGTIISAAKSELAHRELLK